MDYKGFGILCIWMLIFCPLLCSLRVNLDMGKLLYSWTIQRDKAIPDTLVRTSTIAEELGRVEYLLSDKTGTLTQNEMVCEFVCICVCLSVCHVARQDGHSHVE